MTRVAPRFSGHDTSMINEDLRNEQRVGQLDMAMDDMRAALSKSRQISIGIVGAGFAGLRCADVLLRHGAKVTILEARNRLGGRIAHGEIRGRKVDLGPNWIHGSNDNPILRLAHDTGTTLHNWDESSSLIFDPSGELLDFIDTAECGEIFWDDGLVADAFRYSNAHHDSIDPTTSLADFLNEDVKKFFKDLPDDVAAKKRQRLLQYASIWGSYIGTDHHKQSLKHFWLEECIEGEAPFVAGTYSKMLEAVSAAAKVGAAIRLNTVVKQIRHGKARLGDAAAPQVSVLTDAGDSLDFDEVVVTTPLGWLKHNKSAFDPPLEPRLASAIDNIGYGSLDKIYMTFPRAFWMNERSASAGTLQWLEPTYDEHNPHRWGHVGMNLASLPADDAHPTILFYIFGDCAAHVGDIVRSSATKDEADARLIRLMQPYYSLLPSYDANDHDACKPAAVLATAWVNDEFAGYGSYSNFQVPLENGAEDVKVMRHGMPESGLWLAGEHTAPFIAMGTSTGAYWSGEAVAKRIAQAYGLKSAVC